MTKYTELEYLKLSKWRKFLYKIACFFVGIPGWFVNLFKKIGSAFKDFGISVKDDFVDIFTTFKNGDYKTRLSFVIMGFGSIARGQILRGVLFLLFELVFIVYMIFWGGYWISMLPSLGTQGAIKEYDPIYDTYVTTYYDDSFKILLYGILTIFFIVAFLYTWRLNVKQNAIAEEILKSGKPAPRDSEWVKWD